ncbi:hypothetical protein EC968_010143 [Mortierella alpina]|nr:hypothetical protein EC968_010143 [Mortierella alpina]
MHRFSDLVVHMLWNSLVFHGHDTFQMQSMLSTLGQEHQPAHEKPQPPSAPINRQGFISRIGSGCGVSSSVKANAGGLRGLRKSVLQGLVNDVCPRAADDLPNSPSLSSSWAKLAVLPRWTYSSLVRRVVLNFAHPQASPQMLVRVLECLRSQCGSNQIQALDLHANEKMRASELGLDTAAELDRLFGGHQFSGLQYLRLQGGFVDNQLLGALLKGLSLPIEAGPQQSCGLSQVFLGPGSVTDSTIEKLIAVAGHSLEVFSVTSCVDVGGGALASLLTKCPKLRVLGVHKSLASDKELLAGLRIDSPSSRVITAGNGATGLASLETLSGASGAKAIIAPLERLELGTVKLTTVGVSEIVKGTCQTLRFLSLGSRHFKEDFLKGVILTTCKRLEGFNIISNKLNKLNHNNHNINCSINNINNNCHYHLSVIIPLNDNRVDGSSSLGVFRDGSGRNPLTCRSLISHVTIDRVSNYPKCDLLCHNNRTVLSLTKTAYSVLGWEKLLRSIGCYMGTARPRGSLSTLLRSVSNHFATLFAVRDSVAVTDVPSDSDNNIMDDDTTASNSDDAADESQDDLFERFEVSRATVQAIHEVLRPLLKDFMVMHRDVISEMQSVTSLVAESSVVPPYQTNANEAAPPMDQLEVFLRLVVILGVIILGTAHTGA